MLSYEKGFDFNGGLNEHITFLNLFYIILHSFTNRFPLLLQPFQLHLSLLFFLQLATNTLERVAPLTHAVGNVLKRVFVIGFSIVVFGRFSVNTCINNFLLILHVSYA